MRHVLLFLSVTFLGMTLSGCNRSAGQPGKTREPGAVRIDTPKKKAMTRLIEQPAAVEPYQDAPLVARIPGYVDKVYVDIDQEVKGPKRGEKGKPIPGELLAELSVPEMLKELAQKSALVKQAQEEVNHANALVGEADAAILKADAGVERWSSEYVRLKELAKVVEKQIVEETLQQFKSAKAAKAEATARKAKALADVEVAKARVTVAKAEESRFAELADFRHIRAPFDGVVTRRNVHPGHFLQPNAGPLFVVMQTDKLRIVAEVPELEASYIKANLQAQVHIPALKDEPFAGTVARTSLALDPKSRTLRVEIDYLNKDKKLRPGMFATVIFSASLGERTTLPASAFFTHADQPCCWRVVDGKAVRTPVKLGIRDGQDVEVLQMRSPGMKWEPVTGKEEIVVSNLGVVTDGKELRIAR